MDTGVLTPIPVDDPQAGTATFITPPDPDTGVVSPPPVDQETSYADSPPPAPRPNTFRGAGPLVPGQTFGVRYHIIRLLGVGGMGAVYHAWDSELGVAVALKVIKPEVMADPTVGPEVALRFKRELLLARQVTHKNVVRIHDLGDIDGIKYITMSYVEGYDLATILKREKRLPVARALRIARAIVSGLQAAHEAGVVHRDLKPENIMIDAEHQALIMDFGIARSTAAQAVTPPVGMPTAVRRKSARVMAASQTMVGTVVGTLPYMSPEQARGEPVDQRSDIYAFGLILYDMLVGRKRLSAGTPAMTELEERCVAPPQSARSINSDVPQALDAIITRCVQPNLAVRYQTTAELVADLEQLDESGHHLPITRRVTRTQFALAAAGVLLLLATTWQATRWLTPPPPQAARPAVSVLIADFENTTNDPVFDGALEQVLTLAMEDAVFINSYPRATAMTVAAQLKPGVTRISEETARLVVQREPDIRYVLAGRIARDGNGYRLSVRAVDPVPGTAVAEESTTVNTKGEVLQALGSLAARIREALGDAKSETERLTANESFTAASLEAARHYSEAQRLANSGKDEEALAYYDRALAEDPNLGRAYASKALSASKLGRTAEAEALWKEALAKIDRMTDRERYRTLGTYYMDVLGNDEQGLEQYRQLVLKFPFDGAAHNNLANAYFRLLDFRGARQEGLLLLKIYPKSVLYNYNYALFSLYAGDFSEAESAAKTAIDISPTAPPHKAYFALATAALARNDVAAARAAYAAARDKAGARGASLAAIGLADIAMYQGDYAEAIRVLTAGIADDEDPKNKNAAAAAAKYVALAEAQIALKKTGDALAAVDRALKMSQTEAVVVPAARVLIAAGREKEARALGEMLDARLRPRSRAYGKLIAGEIALHRGQITEAVDAFRASQQFADNTTIVKGATKGYWLARFDLGVAYVLAGAEQSAAAFSELEACLKRQGEAGAIFLDDVPTYRYLVPLWYWMARAQDGLQMKSEAETNFRKFLALRPAATGDPLAADAAKRMSAAP